MEIVSGNAVSDFLARVTRRPERYREVLVCTPFLDDVTVAAMRDMALLTPRVRCGFRLVTRAVAARMVLQRLPAPLQVWRQTIRVRPRIHAKVYFALARAYRHSEAIITSANLTLDGMTLNDELGIRFTGETASGRSALAGLRSNIQKWIH